MANYSEPASRHGHVEEPEDTEPALSARELATVLAALRNWQMDALNCRSTATAEGSMFRGYFEDHAPLDGVEIDALCDRLNR